MVPLQIFLFLVGNNNIVNTMSQVYYMISIEFPCWFFPLNYVCRLLDGFGILIILLGFF